MIQVKLFKDSSRYSLEGDINEFLSSGEVSEIVDIKFWTASETVINYVVLLIYKK